MQIHELIPRFLIIFYIQISQINKVLTFFGDFTKKMQVKFVSSFRSKVYYIASRKYLKFEKSKTTGYHYILGNKYQHLKVMVVPMITELTNKFYKKKRIKKL